MLACLRAELLSGREHVPVRGPRVGRCARNLTGAEVAGANAAVVGGAGEVVRGPLEKERSVLEPLATLVLAQAASAARAGGSSIVCGGCVERSTGVGASSSRSDPTPCSTNRRADTRTRRSSDPTAWL